MMYQDDTGGSRARIPVAGQGRREDEESRRRHLHEEEEIQEEDQPGPSTSAASQVMHQGSHATGIARSMRGGGGGGGGRGRRARQDHAQHHAHDAGTFVLHHGNQEYHPDIVDEIGVHHGEGLDHQEHVEIQEEHLDEWDVVYDEANVRRLVRRTDGVWAYDPDDLVVVHDVEGGGEGIVDDDDYDTTALWNVEMVDEDGNPVEASTMEEMHGEDAAMHLGEEVIVEGDDDEVYMDESMQMGGGHGMHSGRAPLGGAGVDHHALFAPVMGGRVREGPFLHHPDASFDPSQFPRGPGRGGGERKAVWNVQAYEVCEPSPAPPPPVYHGGGGRGGGRQKRRIVIRGMTSMPPGLEERMHEGALPGTIPIVHRDAKRVNRWNMVEEEAGPRLARLDRTPASKPPERSAVRALAHIVPKGRRRGKGEGGDGEKKHVPSPVTARLALVAEQRRLVARAKGRPPMPALPLTRPIPLRTRMPRRPTARFTTQSALVRATEGLEMATCSNCELRFYLPQAALRSRISYEDGGKWNLPTAFFECPMCERLNRTA